LRSISVQDLRV
nr:immunoglobulin heavy chain junction region [Mus musculus]